MQVTPQHQDPEHQDPVTQDDAMAMDALPDPCEGEPDGRDPDGGFPVPIGMYRVGIQETYVERDGDSTFLCWDLGITAPLGRTGTIVKRSRVDTPEDALALRREFAVLGVNIHSWLGLDQARARVRNRHAIVEVLPSSEPGWNRVHIMQAATTHDLALPGEHGITAWEERLRSASMDFGLHAPVFQYMAAEHPDGTVEDPTEDL